MSIPYIILTYDPPSSPISFIGLNKKLPDHPPHQHYPSAVSHRSTPPKESKSSGGERADKTPSARAKVLPWVQGVHVAEDAVPDGMFGPYPSRPQSMAEPTQSRHPFAYPSIPTLPFAALGAGNRSADNDAQDYVKSQRPESEVLSRGAGMRAMAKPHNTTGNAGDGEETPGGMSSIGMGTFGLEGQSALGPAGIPLPKSKYTGATGVTGSPKKSQYTTRKPPPTDPLPPDPPTTKPESDGPEVVAQPHEHKPHHEYPFSHVEAQAKLVQAMEQARAAALAQLEAAQRNSAIEMEQEMLAALENHTVHDREKGPRQTYDTMDSGPSFGHLLHQNGIPLSARQSAQVPQGSANQADFFRIPFGVPLGMNVPRPLLVMRDSAGAGLGLGLSPDLLEILEQDQGISPRGPEDRSAFVETVEDEEASGIPSDVRTATPSKGPTPSPQANRTTGQSAARSESGVFGAHPAAPRSTAQTRAPASARAPTEHVKSPSVAPSAVRSRAPTKAPTKAPTVVSAVPAFPKAPSVAPTVRSQARSAAPRSQAPKPVLQETLMEYPDGHTIYSQVRTKKTPTIIPNTVHDHDENEIEYEYEMSHHGSVAPTTISNVKKLVAESRFHDETLCQLLDAARLNLIGEAAKKALQRAARARVIELRELRERGAIEEGLREPVIPEEPQPKSTQSTPKKEKRSKSRDRSRKKSASEKAETVAITQDPPAWAQDIMGRLAAFDAEFTALEQQKHDIENMGQNRPATQHSQTTHEIPSQYLNELIFNDMPSSGFTHGINMPQGLTQSILYPEHNSRPPMPGPANMKATTHYTHPAQSSHGMDQPTRANGTGYSQHAPTAMPSHRTQYAPTAVPSHHASQAPTQYTQRAPTVAASQHTQQPPSQARNGAGTNVNPADIPTWGSEVELPQVSNDHLPTGPTINILAPTESGLGPNGRPSTRAPSPSVHTQARSRGPSRAGTHQPGPDHVEVTIIHEQPLPEAAMPDPNEREVPAPPSESLRSHRPTPPSKSTPMDANTVHTARVTTAPSQAAQTAFPQSHTAHSAQHSQAGTMPYNTNAQSHVGHDQFPVQSAYIGTPDAYPPTLTKPVPSSQVAPTKPATTTVQQSTIHMRPHNVMMSPPKHAGTPPRRDMIHIIDPLLPQMRGWQPWDMLTQRLYSWALIAEEKSFVRALEEVSLGRQVEEFPLSIFLMMTYKRLIRRNLSENPPIPSDKLFVPPNIASAINVAVHARRYHDAKEILLELWNSLGSDEPPRVIISLAPLGNDLDQWAAHRYDLVTRHLTSYRVSHLEDMQIDGRSFWWWAAIGQAWPQLQIPSMDTLEQSGKQRIINERRPPEHRHDNSLYAANISRNLLLGYRPERQQDLTKLRELVWAEVKRLLGKKRHGKLVVEPESPEHLYDA
nr:uncharacterized protein I303_08220 [Kwoniella dejecticola CBS 10117]OBR81450.1 hypothetical protein I303_08220 [Kwoniella dejecticola CBS 10117]